MPRNQAPISRYSSPRSPTPIAVSRLAVQPQQRPGFFSNMWQGFGLGTGMNIANSLFGQTTKTVVMAPAAEPLLPPKPKEYVQCMKDNDNDKELCEQFLKG